MSRWPLLTGGGDLHILNCDRALLYKCKNNRKMQKYIFFRKMWKVFRSGMGGGGDLEIKLKHRKFHQKTI